MLHQTFNDVPAAVIGMPAALPLDLRDTAGHVSKPASRPARGLKSSASVMQLSFSFDAEIAMPGPRALPGMVKDEAGQGQGGKTGRQKVLRGHAGKPARVAMKAPAIGQKAKTPTGAAPRTIGPAAVTYADMVLQSRAQGALLSRETEVALAEAWATKGDIKARERLLMAYQRYVVRAARDYAHTGIALTDLCQEGYIGLMRAAEDYDATRGFRFATYARWWIRASIQEAVIRDTGIVRVKSSRNNRFILFSLRKLERIAEINLSRQGANPTENAISDEICRLVGMERDKFDVLRASVTQRVVTRVQGEDGDFTDMVNLIPDDACNPEDALINESGHATAARIVAKCLAELGDREKMIILKRTMADKDDALSLRKLAAMFDISPERVRQIEARTCARIREMLEACGITSSSSLFV